MQKKEKMGKSRVGRACALCMWAGVVYLHALQIVGGGAQSSRSLPVGSSTFSI